MSYDKFPSLSALIDSYTIDQSNKVKCTCRETKNEATDTSSKKFGKDSKLINWDKWMLERKNIQKKLSEALNRGKDELLMTSFEHIRYEREEKMVLEYTKIPKPDAERGCPGFFKLPECLKNACNPSEGTPYFVQKTKEDMCQIPVIEYVTVPYDIRKEKHIPREICTGQQWFRSEYRQEVQRKKRESGELQYVQPHEPDIDDMMIHGSSKHFTTKTTNVTYKSTSSIFHPTEIYHNGSIHELFAIENEAALYVDNFELRCDKIAYRKLIIPFNYNVDSNKVMTKTITLTNTGTVTLRFQLQPVKETRIFKEILSEEKAIFNFNFNKNEEIILPGQTIVFPFWFETKTHGKYSETWKLRTTPSVTVNESKFLIVLQAYSEFGNISTKCAVINEYLNTQVTERLRVENELKVQSEISKCDTDPFLPKARVFEAVNTNFNPTVRKPKYIYDHDAVVALEQFYKKIKKPDDAEIWNLSIDLLWKRAKEKEVEEYYEKHKGIKCNTVKKDLSVQKKPAKKSKQSSRSSSKSTVKEKSTSDKRTDVISKAEKVKTLTMELEELLQKCAEPFVRSNPQQKKYQLAYKILSVHVDKMCASIEAMEENLHINELNKNYQAAFKLVHNYSPRLICDTLNDYESYSSIYDRTDLQAESVVQTDCLQNISKEKIDEKFKLYREIVLGIKSDDADASGKSHKKKGKGKKDKPKTEKLKTTKATKIKEKKKGKKHADSNKETKTHDFTCPPFNARIKFNFSDTSVNVAKHESDAATEKISDTESIQQMNLLSHYKYNLYTIVYNELQSSVMEITYMIDTFAKKALTHRMIKKIEDERDSKRMDSIYDLKNAMEENKLKDIVIECKKKMNIIQTEASANSIWTILDAYKEERSKLKVDDRSLPISYPVENVNEIEKNLHPIEIQTETDGGVVDEFWQKGWPVAVQTSFTDRGLIDLEEAAEILERETPAQQLLEKEKQENEHNDGDEENASQEEQMYVD